MKIVMSAFPGTGKSEIFKRALELGLKPAFVQFDDHTLEYELHIAKAPGIPVFDSDSSKFDKNAFPGNYIKHIQNVLNTCNDVVILVSSHDNVREALRDAGIEYHLCYPQIELKADYIERYKERGSPEAFVNMMEEKWVDFIGSCEADPTPLKCILSEGEYLIDYLKPLLNKERYPTAVVNGTESIGDVVTDAEGNPVAVYGPNGLEELPPPPSEDDQPAPDQSTEEPTRYENIGVALEMESDIGTLEKVVEVCQTPERDGLEGYEDNGTIFVAASADIKQRYGTDVEPTLAGMEGFLDSLKEAFQKVKDMLKKEPTKQQQAQIKKYFFEAEKAFNVYGSDKWQNDQTFINVGKVKLQVPDIFKDINSPKDIENILSLVNKRTVDTSLKYLKNSKERLQAAVKVFNAFKGKPEDTPVSEVDSFLPIKPEEMKGAVKDSGLDDLDLKLVGVELPVLSKEAIKEVCKVVEQLVDTSVTLIGHDESLIDLSISEDDFYASDFWDKHLDTKQCKEIWNAGYYFDSIGEFTKVHREYNDKALIIAKFLEMWVLQSVK